MGSGISEQGRQVRRQALFRRVSPRALFRSGSCTESTTGLDHAQIEELVARIYQVLTSKNGGGQGRRPILGLYRQAVLTLVLLRQNLAQTVAGDLFGISQPTVSRIYRAMLPLSEQVACLHRPCLPEVLRGRVVLVDGTLVPIGNRRTDKTPTWPTTPAKATKPG
jgi:hypothetical protein